MRPVSSRTASPEHTQLEGEPLMTAESSGDARDVLADFPGLAVDEIPVTTAGAVNAAALPVLELAGLLAYHPPVTPRQETLCEIFAEALGVARCGVSSDFFDLGGRSVEAMLLAGRISTAFGARVSMADLFRAPTAGDMDRRLDQIADTRK
jgi:Phosphopantetheine attachment site